MKNKKETIKKVRKTLDKKKEIDIKPEIKEAYDLGFKLGMTAKEIEMKRDLKNKDIDRKETAVVIIIALMVVVGIAIALIK